MVKNWSEKGVQKPLEKLNKLDEDVAHRKKMIQPALDFNPCSKVDKHKFDNVQNKILFKADEQTFFASFESDWARDVCLFVLNTGLSQNDVLGLSKFHVDWKQREIRLVQGKTKRIVEIPLNDSAYKVLNKRRHNGSDLFFPSPRQANVESLQEGLSRGFVKSQNRILNDS